MLDALPWLGLFVIGFWLVRRTGWDWALIGVWLNLAWFIYQNEAGSGWLMYLRGVGLAALLAVGYRRYWLAWALLPWPLLLYARFNLPLLWPYEPAWGEGFILGMLVYLIAGLFRRPA
ncbi:MAG: hypothetical protein IVW51_02995 [Thermaceae bacterium]|nr:hypothetical protein [Thermaceae bacterium]